jgi:2-polyprenyl-3-methyl-5-hydroxy-6-metoxy-1,4-benzoquinol methylase
MSKVCPSFLSFFLDNRLRKLIMDPAKILGPFVREGFTAADIGCGPGFFTVPMARLVGPRGKVYAVDLQGAMLEKVERKARESGLAQQVIIHPCSEERLGLTEPLDFVLCFWMVHEVPSPERSFEELRKQMKPGGVLLLAEPRAHVGKASFKQTVEAALNQGFTVQSEPRIRGSYSVLLAVDPASRNTREA